MYISNKFFLCFYAKFLIFCNSIVSYTKVLTFDLETSKTLFPALVQVANKYNRLTLSFVLICNLITTAD